MAARACLLVVADYRYVVACGRTFASIPWDESQARLYPKFSRILLLGRLRRLPAAPDGWFEVDQRFYEVLDGGDWDTAAGFLRNLGSLWRVLGSNWDRIAVLYLKLFYLNALVAWAYNRLSGRDRRPVATLLVGDSPAALLLRHDLLRWGWMRRAGAGLVSAVLRAVQKKVESPGFVAAFLAERFGSAGRANLIANESWLHEGQISEHVRDGARRPCNVLFAGRLVALKRVNLLLGAIAQLRAEGDNVCCTVVGDGPERASLQQQADSLGIGQQVIFAGWLQVLGTEMLAAYDAADVFCLPSFSEGLPLVLIEAMARGVPVVATAVSGTPELVNHEKSGLLIPRDDVAALVASIRRLANDRELWRRCVSNGYIVARRNTFEVQRSRLAGAIGQLAS